MQINTSTPQAKQNFGAAKFYKIPADMQEIMKANKVFNKIAEEQDIIVTAKPRSTWRDPLGLRTPKADEKCYLEYEVNDLYTSFGKPSATLVATDSKIFAPLKEHVHTLLKQLEIDRFLNRFID